VVGSVVWASFACISSAAISTALGGQPLVSIIISAIATTALLGVLYKRMKQSLQNLRKSDNEAMLGSDG
jgi:membrane protein implicated in regulation of membrane protease activity